MKIQSLAIIFVIIILPVSMVLSEYIDNLITTQQIEMEYDKKLLDSTYDAIKAYQLNTVNNAFGDVTTEKVNDIEAAAKTFLNSLASNFGYTGYQSSVMQEYVSAVVFTMYDGYYIYSPFENTLTGVENEKFDETFSNKGQTRYGLKPYVYYNCRYKIDDKNDFVITYTLANYITIQGKIDGKYIYDYGYIYSIADNVNDANDGKGIYEGRDSSTGKKYYIYNGVEFREEDTEELKEYVGNKEYSYVKINGKKYYLDENYYQDRQGVVELDGGKQIDATAGIFYIDSDGRKNYNQTKGYSTANTDSENTEFLRYCNAIKNNKSAYEYFKNAYEFSNVAFGDGIPGYKDKGGTEAPTNGYGLENLETRNAIIYGNNAENSGGTDVNSGLSNDITNIEEYGNFKIFDGDNIGQAGSNFEEHRKAVIRYVVETNLTTAIASFASFVPSTNNNNFIMPKISETDWETIENDICGISFMQGMNIGAKKYNGYAVVANNLTKEYVDENDIYILAEDNNNGSKVYCKAIDQELLPNGRYKIIEKKDGEKNYYSGLWKIDFELKQDASVEGEETVIYQPASYNSGGKREAYLGSYTSIMGSTGIPAEKYADMHSYMKDKNYELKKAYYFGLARERWGSFNINNINYEIYNGNGNDYFINDY